MLAFGIIIPVLPHLIEQLAGGGIARAAFWVGHFQHRVRARAVRILAGAGRAVGPVRPAPGDPDLQPRPGHRLRACWRWRLRCGCCSSARIVPGMTQPASAPRMRISPTSRRRKSAPPPSACWAARSDSASSSAPALGGFLGGICTAAAVLGRGGPGAVQFPLRLLRVARIAAEGKAQRHDSSWHSAHPFGAIEAAAAPAAGVGPGGGVVPDLPGALRRCRRDSCCTPITAMAGARRRWATC